MSLWLTILGAGVVTYAIRLSFILMLERMEVPPRARQALRYVPPAVLSAIVFPELLLRDDEFDLSLGNLRLLAGVLAALVAWRTKSVLLSIAAGLGALWVLQAVVR
jgi:branched-subunit amino acid transport protein